jgi:hypothetical protein
MSVSRRTFLQSAALLSPLTASAAQPAGEEERAYDPLLDPSCRVHAVHPGPSWPARWIWYPGQLAAYRHAAGVRASMERCVDVGYPGFFRQTEAIACFRRRAVLLSDTAIRWSAPSGRVRLILNGETADITLRKAVLRAGANEIVAVVDFTASLPCFLLDGAGLATGAQWEASLDRVSWVEAEADPAFSDPSSLPDSRREWKVEIPPARIVAALQASAAGDVISFGLGGDLIVDFRHDEIGRLAGEASGSGTLSIVVGESLEEVRDADPRHFEQRPLPEIPLSDRRTAMLLPERCVRYARLRSSAACEIRNLRLEASVWPVKYRGRFESSDAQLNAIWRAAAATMHANMHDFYLDGIRRDALPWHDGLLVVEAGECVFFDAEIARHSILVETLPAKPSLHDIGLIDGPLYLLAAFESEYLARGDVAFSQRYRERIEDVLNLFLSLQDPRGFVSGRDVEPYGFFPDWSATEASGPDAHGTPAYAQMLWMRALEVGQAFATRWGDAALAERYGAAAGKLRHSIREIFWDSSEGAFINGLDRDGAPDRRFTSFAQVNGVLFDLAAPPEWGSMFTRVLHNPARRAPNLSVSQPWEFLAYAKAGRIEESLARLRTAWGGLLDRGYARFPEDIRPRDTPEQQLVFYRRPFGNSLCHAWAGAAPVLGLVRGVLGIRPTEGGYRRCRIAPRLGGLEWARGSVPAPSGDIRVEIDARGARVALPENVTADLTGYVVSGGRSITGPGTFDLQAERG